MQTITIQIQLEPDIELNNDQIAECRAAMNETCTKMEHFGFVRCQLYENLQNWEPKE